MKMTRSATQRARAFSFDNFATENKANSAYRFRKRFFVIVKASGQDFFMVCTLIDHRNDAIKSVQNLIRVRVRVRLGLGLTLTT